MFDEVKLIYKQKSVEIRYIIINVVVFLLIKIAMFSAYLFQSSFNLASQGLSMPAAVTDFTLKPWTIATYMFTHVGLFHLLSNMIWLYFGGRIFSDLLGEDKFIKTYWIGGILGALFYLVAYNLIPSLDHEHAILLGASASVMAIFIGISVYVPDYTVMLPFIGSAKLKYIAIVFVILSLPLSHGNEGGQLAHLGGLVWGFMWAYYLKKGRDLGGWFDRLHLWVKSFSDPSLKKTRKKKSGPGSNSRARAKSKTDLDNQEEIDRILDKVGKSGYESLSSDEKKTLFNASK